VSAKDRRTEFLPIAKCVPPMRMYQNQHGYRANQMFHVCSLPGSPRSGEHHFDVHILTCLVHFSPLLFGEPHAALPWRISYFLAQNASKFRLLKPLAETVGPENLPPPQAGRQPCSKTCSKKCIDFLNSYLSSIEMTHNQAIQARELLLKHLPCTSEVLRGSLFERITFHTSGCRKCARGEGHPQTVLSISYRGARVRQFTIHREQVPQVRQWLSNYQKLKETIEAVCELNHVLLRPDPVRKTKSGPRD
jgi:hypothetical protein